ncbi:hypothetical protein E2C01_066210 [Portunus trituberculatus]|uniref:Uncharacterized protein n=1 Tax=Portunus trituberculatus TaxID=210409 RepID=A0A5B7HT87_PORTR|nr:hypothetical protein [Portunus trituberculatus]
MMSVTWCSIHVTNLATYLVTTPATITTFTVSKHHHHNHYSHWSRDTGGGDSGSEVNVFGAAEKNEYVIGSATTATTTTTTTTTTTICSIRELLQPLDHITPHEGYSDLSFPATTVPPSPTYTHTHTHTPAAAAVESRHPSPSRKSQHFSLLAAQARPPAGKSLPCSPRSLQRLSSVRLGRGRKV